MRKRSFDKKVSIRMSSQSDVYVNESPLRDREFSFVNKAPAAAISNDISPSLHHKHQQAQSDEEENELDDVEMPQITGFRPSLYTKRRLSERRCSVDARSEAASVSKISSLSKEIEEPFSKGAKQ